VLHTRGGSRNFIWGPRGAEDAEVERRRREDRCAAGAEGVGCGELGRGVGRGVGCGEGVSPSSPGEGLRRGLCPLPRNFFQYCIIKWPVLVDSDVLHVLLIVVVKLETCT